MEAWVTRALQRWPNVPALFGWLKLDRDGRWLIRDEPITRPQIIDTINANYAADDYGRWYFQNGPQRGYIELQYAPFVLQVSADGTTLSTHTNQIIAHPARAFIDEQGAFVLLTEHGPGVVDDNDLEWVLAHLRQANHAITEPQLTQALALPSEAMTQIEFVFGAQMLPLMRLDADALEAYLKFTRNPQPRAGERTSSGAPD